MTVAMLTAAMCCVAGTDAAAHAEVPSIFGEHGEGAGQLRTAIGIAVAQETGDVFLADTQNARVDEFTSGGGFERAWGWGVIDKAESALQVCTGATGCVAGSVGTGAGEFDGPEGVAIDNSAGFSHGDVYVMDSLNARVEKFGSEGQFILTFGGEVNATKDSGGTATAAEKDVCTQTEIEIAKVECRQGVGGEGNGEFANARNAIGVNAEGKVYVGDGSGRVQRFSEDGEYEATVLRGLRSVEGLAVASDGDLYVLSGGQLQEYASSGAKIGSPLDGAGTPRAVAANGEGGVFVDDRTAGHRILEYDATGTQTESFDKQSFSLDAQNGLALGEKAHALYMLNDFTENSGHIEVDDVRTVVPPPPGPLVVPPVVATAKPHGEAIVKALIDPEGAETEYFVRYGPEGSLVNASVVKQLAESFEESEVTVELSGLEFSARYGYCIIAKNANGETPCVEHQFRSAPATSIDAEWVQDVTSTSLTLAAEVNPEETTTQCAFEYGTATLHASGGGFQYSAAASAIVAPEDADVIVSAHVQEGIVPGAEYVYRLVCRKEGVSDDGGVQSFRSGTQSGAALMDRRVQEVVAVDANGAALMPPDLGGLPQAAEAGDGIVYLRRMANSADASGNRAPEPTVDIARHREGAGWSSTDITTPYGEPTPLVGRETEYQIFSSDLSAAVVTPRDATPLAPSASERTPYRRTEAVGEAFYEPLLTASDVAEGVKFGEERAVEVQGANAALSHVVLYSLVALTRESVPKALYEWSAGRLVPVSVLPAAEGGKIVEGGLGGPHRGERTGNARGAVSADGALVYWQHGPGLYVSDTETGESLRLDEPVEGVVPRTGEAEGAEFQIASTDGSHVFFTSIQRLTPGAKANAEAPDLYECTVVSPPAGPLSCSLSDVTEATAHAGERANVQGLLAAADAAGDRVFFVAKGALAAGASAGEYNLYTAALAGGAWHTAWIATLAAEDAPDWAAGEAGGMRQLTERSSANGRYFTFMSARSLTGYDNHDLASGASDEEVYLYDAQSGRLACASCDPTGARPRGLFDDKRIPLSATSSPVDVIGTWRNHWIAGLLSGWQNLPDQAEGIAPYQPRSLSDSGRLFFDSATALTSQAVNGAVGVYEFEPAGVGSCTTGAAGYSAGTGGCVGLISPGSAVGDSVFMDASANGDDVFVMSRAGGPATEGGSGSYSMLDAHSCEAGSSWPCASSTPVATGGCKPGAGCKAHAVVVGQGLPASAAFSGAGNVSRRVAKVGGRNACRARAMRSRSRRKRRRALARCRSHRHRGHRRLRPHR